jgi:hypothetical protein
MLAPHAPLPAAGEWDVLSSFGIRPPDAIGLGLFLEGGDRFSHLGGAASFFSALTGSSRDGRGAVVMTAANATPYLFELLRTIDEGWGDSRG